MPFLSMRGPEFLLVYAILAAAGCGWLQYSIGRRETETGSRVLRVRDPYEIAYLRGGTRELVQVVALSLIRRRLLIPTGARLVVRSAVEWQGCAPVEAAVLRCCRPSARAEDLPVDSAVQSAAEAYRNALIQSGLMPADPLRRLRNRQAGTLFLLLAALSAARLLHAFATDHGNVGFLVLLTAVAGVLLYTIAARHRTRPGDRAVADLKTLFARVRRSARSLQPDQHPEALLLAAVFGVYAVPGMSEQAWRKLFARSGSSSGDGGADGGDGGGCGCGGGCGGCGS